MSDSLVAPPKNLRDAFLILTVGIPGAGKSTWAKWYASIDPTHKMVIVSTDQLRKELTGSANCDPSQNEFIHSSARQRAKEFLEKGYDVIVDSTNVDLEEWIKYKHIYPSVFIAKVFNISPAEAMVRQEGRERKVPLKILEDKWDKLQENKKHLSIIFDLII